MIATEYIKDRAAELRRLREESRAALRALGAKDDTPLLQTVLFAAEDLDAVAGELERLSARASDMSLRGAVVGFLRAEGYSITEPVERKPAFALAAPVVEDEPPPSHNDAAWMAGRVTAEEEPLPEAAPASYRPLPPGELGPGDYGPDSFGGQDAPHAPAVATSDPDASRPRRGAFAIVCGESQYAGRHVMLHEQRGNSWVAELLAKSVQLTTAIPMNAAALLFEFPDPDKQPSLFTNTVPVPAAAKAPDAAPAEATAPKPARTPEADKPVSDWNPSEREIGEMAAIVGHPIERTAALIATFRADNATAKPQARWRVPFCKWAKSQPKA